MCGPCHQRACSEVDSQEAVAECIDLDLRESTKLGIEVNKRTDGWLVLRVKDGPLQCWNSQAGNKPVWPGDVLVSVDGLPLGPGMELALAAQGRPRIGLKRARIVHHPQTFQDGALLWDLGNALLKVMWRDGNEGFLIKRRSEYRLVRKAVAEAFSGESSVAVLNAKGLGDEGAKEVAWTLQALKNCPVTHICLNDNRIRNEGAKALAEAVDDRVCIKGMDLFGNYIHPELRERIDETLLARKEAKLVLTVLASACGNGSDVALSFRTVSGSEPIQPCVRRKSTTFKELRNYLEEHSLVRVMLMTSGPTGRLLNNDEVVGDLLGQT